VNGSNDSELCGSRNDRGTARDNVADCGRADKNIRFVYLSSRPISLANATRKFLRGVRQRVHQEEAVVVDNTVLSANLMRSVPSASFLAPSGSGHRLPPGPFLGFPGTLPQVVTMELWSKNVNEFKHRTIRDQVIRPFEEVRRQERSAIDCRFDDDVGATNSSSILMAGFGNTLMDMQAYHSAGLGLDRLYLINKESGIHCLDDESPDIRDSNEIRRRSRSLRRQRSLQDEESNRSRNTRTVPGRGTATDAASDSTPMDRRHYWRARGSFFQQGYDDEGLVSHVLTK